MSQLCWHRGLYEPTFIKLTGQDLQAKIKIIKELGNRAVHGTKPIPRTDSYAAVRELFHFTYWFARTYARTAAGRPPVQAFFNGENLPKTSLIPPQTVAQLTKLAEELATRDAKLLELGEELKQVRAEVAEAKLRNQAQPDPHDYSEAETRDFYIDLMLREAGWPLDQPQDREFPVDGMPEGKGRADYVLWGDNGKPLAVVEAKRTKRDATAGQQQAKLYADCLEKQYGQRPLIFLTNGYEHQLWDDQFYPPRKVQGFYKKDELELAIERRRTRRLLSSVEIDNAIVERHYQHRAIRRVSETFEQRHGRRALVEMATGAGKTRTVIALIDVLMRANWVKRVLFLADRVALVNQAVKAFKVHLPSAAPVNLVTERTTVGRVYVSTYQTLMGLIEEKFEGQRRFGSGHFDLIVIDETHRSVYQKYGAIFD